MHLEQTVARLKSHISEQDQEIFKLARRVDSLTRRLDKLVKQVNDANPESPVQDDSDPASERPPHY